MLYIRKLKDDLDMFVIVIGCNVTDKIYVMMINANIWISNK